jgi:hypothetical protein
MEISVKEARTKISSLARKVRLGDLSRPDGDRILSKFLSHLDSDWHKLAWPS